MIPLPPCRITHEKRLPQIHARNVQIVIIQELAPHAHARFAELVVLGGRVDAQGHVKVQRGEHSRGALLEVGQAFGFAGFRVIGGCAGFLGGFGLDCDLLLVGDDHDLIAGPYISATNTARQTEKESSGIPIRCQFLKTSRY